MLPAVQETKRPEFKKTAKQKEATRLLASVRYPMLFGGSRSGKTFEAVRCIIVRACKVKSEHLICRLCFDHVKRSIGMKTLPEVMEICFPDLPYKLDKSDWIVTLPNESRIWLGGTDDDKRVEKILGTEFSTIYFNESSQWKSFEVINTILTRLAEKNDLNKRAYFDCNPPGKKHWTYRLFFDHVDPITEEPLPYPEDYAHLLMNPRDNLENIDSGYIKMLQGFSKRQRDRFLDGLFLSDIEGALWTDSMIVQAEGNTAGTPIRTVVSVDPAVTNEVDSDETGIHVGSLDDLNQCIIHEDLSLKASTRTWAQVAVNAYYKWEANVIVVESNQGGDLIVDAIKAIDPKIKVVKIHASKGKFARAEPVAALYELGRVCHETSMPKTNQELTEWVPIQSKKSPNRLDSLVWLVTYLLLPEKIKRNVRVMVV